MKKALTQKFVDSDIKVVKKTSIHDAVCPNLALNTYPTGHKSYMWIGIIHGKLTKYTLGSSRAHTLAHARAWAMEQTRKRDLGIDIMGQRSIEERERDRRRCQTCDVTFNLYMEYEGGQRKSASEKLRLYNREIKPRIGSRSIFDIGHDDLANILQEKLVESESGSNALQALICRWCKWCVTRGRHLTGLTSNPAVDLVKLATPRSRSRFLSDYEIRLLLQALSTTRTKLADPLRLILYTGVRRAEAFELPWSELDDLHKGIWVIPGTRTKNGMDHLLPLPSEMVEMLQAIPRKPGARLVWPSKPDRDQPMSGFSKAVSALHREMTKLAAKDGRMVEPWSIHDLRRTVASGMNGLHDADHRPLIPSIVIERVINHKLPGVLGVYNRWDYVAEKKAALRLWADHLAKLQKASSANADEHQSGIELQAAE